MLRDCRDRDAAAMRLLSLPRPNPPGTGRSKGVQPRPHLAFAPVVLILNSCLPDSGRLPTIVCHLRDPTQHSFPWELTLCPSHGALLQWPPPPGGTCSLSPLGIRFKKEDGESSALGGLVAWVQHPRGLQIFFRLIFIICSCMCARVLGAVEDRDIGPPCHSPWSYRWLWAA